MSQKGENIYKRKDGRWEARYEKGRKPDGSIRYGYCYAHSYREARDKASKAKIACVANPFASAAASKRKFQFFCDEWLKMVRAKIKQSTYIKYMSVLEKHIKPFFGNLYLQSLSSAIIADFSWELLCIKRLSPKTVKDILVLLSAVIKYTKKQNPELSSIEIVYPREKKEESRVLTKEEQEKLICYLLADIDRCKFGVILALETGLRIGEICALHWRDISFSNSTVRVVSTMQRLKIIENSPLCEKTNVVISKPKSYASLRVIPLTDRVIRLCKRWSTDDPSAFVLTGDAKSYIEPRTLQYRLKRYARECGLSDLHFHVLRHTFATRCVEVGFEIKSLSEILGHSSPKVTLERYVHSSLDLKRENMNKLSSVGY